MGDQRTIVITGASTGIGRACAERFHHLGWRVFAGVRRESDGERLRAATSDSLVPIVLDVTDDETISEAARQVDLAVGRPGLQGLVNNAGIGVGGPVEGLDLDSLRLQFEVNLFGQVAVSQAFLPLLRRGGGRVVNMSSIAGKVAQPFMAPYCASKHALEAFTDSMRQELKPWGIHVVSVEPGVIQTPIWDKARTQAGAARGAMSPQIAELYGKSTERLQDVLEKLPRRGIPADRVADAVEHAMTARKPRTRYPVGTDAKLGIQLRRLLSDRAFYWVMGKLWVEADRGRLWLMGNRAQRLLAITVSCFALGVQGAVVFGFMGGWYWPFVDYPMYSHPKSATSEFVMDEFRLGPCDASGDPLAVDSRDLGMHSFRFWDLMAAALGTESTEAEEPRHMLSRLSLTHYPEGYCTAQIWRRATSIAPGRVDLDPPWKRVAHWELRP